jgi:hypothetical protein
MLFKAILATAIAAISAVAAPLKARDEAITACAPTPSTACPPPASTTVCPPPASTTTVCPPPASTTVSPPSSCSSSPCSCSSCSSSSYFSPSDTWQYSVHNGAIAAARSLVEIYKSTGNGGKDQSALVTFTYPAAAQNKQCQLEFHLPASANPAGSKKIDVYSSIKPAPGPAGTWAPGNQRNNHIGRLSVVAGGAATWDATYGTSLAVKVPCKAPGTVEAFEFVGVGDFDSINWSPSSGYGPRIVY